MIAGFFEHTQESETVGYAIKKDGTVFSYKFEGFDGGLPVKIGNLVKKDPDEFHLIYDHENYTEVFRFDKNNNLTLINAWVSDKGTREDNYKFPDIFKTVRRMGRTILENYNGFDARLGALTRNFNIVEKRQLEELREKLKELNLVWEQNCEEEESIRDRVQEILVEQLDERDEQIVPEAIALEAKFTEDLGMDSLELFELAMALEEEFGKEILGEEAEKLESVGDVVRFIEGLQD